MAMDDEYDPITTQHELAHARREIERLEGVTQALAASHVQQRERAEKLESAVRWALGEIARPDDGVTWFDPPSTPKPYWWRRILRKLAFEE